MRRSYQGATRQRIDRAVLYAGLRFIAAANGWITARPGTPLWTSRSARATQLVRRYRAAAARKKRRYG